MPDYKATPKQWVADRYNWCKADTEAMYGDPAFRCILELRARVELLEGKYETQRLATLEWGADVDKVKRWSDEHLQRIMKLEAAQPIDEEENDRRFHACMDLIRNATPEQIRAAAGLPERSSLVERVANAIDRLPTKDWNRETWDDEARAAIREVAAWLREQHDGDLIAATVLEREAER